jgi:hypothetical protein
MLTDKQCKNAILPRGQSPRIRASDSGGLYIEVAERWFEALVLEVLL